jgi:hypothetical protein
MLEPSHETRTIDMDGVSVPDLASVSVGVFPDLNLHQSQSLNPREYVDALTGLPLVSTPLVRSVHLP